MLLALRNFLKQNLHGTLRCTLKCNLKFVNVPNDFLHKSQMYLPVVPRMGESSPGSPGLAGLAVFWVVLPGSFPPAPIPVRLLGLDC